MPLNVWDSDDTATPFPNRTAFNTTGVYYGSGFIPIFLNTGSAFHVQYRQETEAEQEARIAEEQHWQQEREREVWSWRSANELAERLLRIHLSSAQQAELDAHQHFTVMSQSGKCYRIRRGKSMNVDLLDARGRPKWTYCAYPSEGVPDADAMLAQKIQLECDEQAYLRIANRTEAWVSS